MAKVKIHSFTKEEGSIMQHKKQFKEGHVLLEGVMLLGIMGILFALMLPTYARCIRRAEEAVCRSNCQQLQKLYEIQLMLQDKTHSEMLLQDFLEMQSTLSCPEGGNIEYEADTITCDRHKLLGKTMRKSA